MSTPWTPGPWKWDEHGNLRGRDRNAVINPNLRRDVLSGVNREADARLITAAPEMAALLAKVMARDFQVEDSVRTAQLLSRIRGEAEVTA